MSHWAYMPKIRFVGRMGWIVANTKIKKEKTKNYHKKVNFQNFQKLFKNFIFLCHKDPLNKTN